MLYNSLFPLMEQKRKKKKEKKNKKKKNNKALDKDASFMNKNTQKGCITLQVNNKVWTNQTCLILGEDTEDSLMRTLLNEILDVFKRKNRLKKVMIMSLFKIFLL